MSDLTEKEQRNARTMLRFLRVRAGGWPPIAEALDIKLDTLERVVNGRRNVTPAVAFRLARLIGSTVDDVLAGRVLSPRVCPHCGHPPDDFTDEETAVDSGGGSPRFPFAVIEGGRSGQ